MEFDKIKEDIKIGLIKRALRLARRAHKKEELCSAKIYKCKLCDELSYAFGGESVPDYHICNTVNYSNTIRGDKEQVGAIDTELLLIDLTTILDKLLTNSELIEEISSQIHYR